MDLKCIRAKHLSSVTNRQGRGGERRALIQVGDGRKVKSKWNITEILLSDVWLLNVEVWAWQMTEGVTITWCNETLRQA